MKKWQRAAGAALMMLPLAACGSDAGADDTTPAPTAVAEEAPAAASNAAPPRYAVKSGIIESRGDAMGETTTLVYFDDNGAREATYTTTVMEAMGQRIETKSAEIRDGDWFYRYDESADEWERWNMKDFAAAAGGMPSLPGGDGTAALMESAMSGASGAKELPARTIAGREATGTEMDAMGMTVRMWTWEGITMRSEVIMNGDPMITEVVSLQVDVPVPPEKFLPPAGAKVVDGVLPGSTGGIR